MASQQQSNAHGSQSQGYSANIPSPLPANGRFGAPPPLYQHHAGSSTTFINYFQQPGNYNISLRFNNGNGGVGLANMPSSSVGVTGVDVGPRFAGFGQQRSAPPQLLQTSLPLMGSGKLNGDKAQSPMQ